MYLIVYNNRVKCILYDICNVYYARSIFPKYKISENFISNFWINKLFRKTKIIFKLASLKTETCTTYIVILLIILQTGLHYYWPIYEEKICLGIAQYIWIYTLYTHLYNYPPNKNIKLFYRQQFFFFHFSSIKYTASTFFVVVLESILILVRAV